MSFILEESSAIPWQGSVIQTSRRAGMMLLDDSLLELYRSGRITRDTMLERAFDPKALDAKVGGGA